MEVHTVKNLCKHYKICVVIPTYNNPKTLRNVLDGILVYTRDVILVNDGSGEETSTILKEYPQIEQLHLPKNKGKGNALKVGFKHALQLGFEYAITLDSDGQHYPTDLPVFVEALEKHTTKDILIIGDRNMNEADVLASSSKGNRVSSYWVRAVTGLTLKDSQSGFRLYPIKAMENIRFFKNTRKFEFEVEAIVKAHWAEIEIMHVPINVLYDMKERVSHFRPFMDIARIVVLIIWFLLVKLFYILPRNLFRRLKKKGVKRFLVEDFLQNQDSPKKKALSIALGVFLGLSPLWGFHTIIVIFLAIFLKLNKVIAFAFSNISLPPFIPFVLYFSVQTGNFILGEESTFTLTSMSEEFNVADQVGSYLLGSITLSITMALVLSLLGYIVLSLFDRKKIVKQDA